MSAIKGINNFKKSQDLKVKANTKKIKEALENIPNKIDKVTLSKVVRLVASEVGLHFTTINKNKVYTEMCEERYLSIKLNSMEKGKKNKTTELDNKTRLLKLDNANLKNQIVGLKNVIERLENGEQSESAVDQIDYKDKFEKLLKHFENQLEIKDGKVVDPYAGVRPVFICEI
jgi:tetrahydrodipicolinate N-succinyltransferase